MVGDDSQPPSIGQCGDLSWATCLEGAVTADLKDSPCWDMQPFDDSCLALEYQANMGLVCNTVAKLEDASGCQ